MKNKLLILFLLSFLFFPANAMKVYQGNPFVGSIYNGYNGYNSSYRPYNSWGQYGYNNYNNYYYNNPFRYNQYKKLTTSQIKEINKIRQKNQIKRNIFSLLNKNNNFNSGSLTGYSLPITNSALNLTPQNNNYYSPTNQMKLFQSPQNGTEFYYNDGRYYKDLYDLDSTTGVKIIYD